RLLGEIRDLKGAAEESIDELRRSLRMMREDFEMVPAIEDYCRTFRDRRHVDVRFEASGIARRLSSEAQLTLFRVLQEALNNAARHAEPKQMAVHLSFEGDLLALSIRDDGKGFDTGQTRSGHYG